CCEAVCLHRLGHIVSSGGPRLHTLHPDSRVDFGSRPPREIQACRFRWVFLTVGFLVELKIVFPSNHSMAHQPPNQSMKPTAPCRDKFSLFATIPSRGLSLSR